MSANNIEIESEYDMGNSKLEEEIKKLLRVYKLPNCLPLNMKEDILRVLCSIGWGCWFADWLNHRIYCLAIERAAHSRTGDIVEFIHFEDIKIDDKSEDFDEDGFCISCGWNSCFPNSHIEYCGYGECEYIKKKYVEIGLKDIFEEDEFKRPLLTEKKESEDVYIYVIKTYDNRNEYMGLFELENGVKSWTNEFQARLVFKVAIQIAELGTLILIRINENSNEDRETIIEKKGRDRIDRY
jgi:hypothetical protein